MSKIAFKPHISGTGILTIEAPNTNSDITCTLPEQAGKLLTDNSPLEKGFKNKLINGGCQVAQRGSVASANGAYKYGGCDRICVAPAGFSASSGTIQQYTAQTGLTTDCGQGLYLSSCTGAGYVDFQQRVESINAKALKGKLLTFSVKAFQNTGVQANAQAYILRPTAGVDNYNTVAVVTTGVTVPLGSGAPFQRVSVTFTPTEADVINGFAVAVQFSGMNGAAGHFVTGDWQLEENPEPTEFEVKNFGLEVMLCQRYYESGFAAWVMYQNAGSGFGSPHPFLVEKRVAPTITMSVQNVVNVATPTVSANTKALSNNATATSTGVVLHSTTFLASAEL